MRPLQLIPSYLVQPLRANASAHLAMSQMDLLARLLGDLGTDGTGFTVDNVMKVSAPVSLTGVTHTVASHLRRCLGQGSPCLSSGRVSDSGKGSVRLTGSRRPACVVSWGHVVWTDLGPRCSASAKSGCSGRPGDSGGLSQIRIPFLLASTVLKGSSGFRAPGQPPAWCP